MPDFITTNLGGLSPNDLSASAFSIAEIMTANTTDFPNPPEKLSDIVELNDKLKPFLKEKEELSTIDRKTRVGIMNLIVKKLQRNGRYVTMLFPEDELKQLSAGYPSARKPQRLTGPPSDPINVRVRRGELSGQLIANCRKSRGTKSINVRMRNHRTGDITVFNSSSGVGIKINDLTSGDTYTVSLQAVGAKGTSDWVSADPIVVG